MTEQLTDLLMAHPRFGRVIHTHALSEPPSTTSDCMRRRDFSTSSQPAPEPMHASHPCGLCSCVLSEAAISWSPCIRAHGSATQFLMATAVTVDPCVAEERRGVNKTQYSNPGPHLEASTLISRHLELDLDLHRSR